MTNNTRPKDVPKLRLTETIAPYRSIARLVQEVIRFWPEHVDPLAKSMLAHAPNDLPMLERLAESILLLAGDSLPRYLENYRWMCEEMNAEQLFFVRNKRYRRSTFAEALAAVYSNPEYMGKYMEGLLVSQLYWHNHAKSYIFHTNFIKSRPPGYSYLEIGPGHGLYLSTVALQDTCVLAEAWDVSTESLRQTESSLRTLGITKPVRLVEMDIQTPQRALTSDGYDVIVISEVLEHLEQPVKALQNLRSLLTARGKIMINFPINSPAPDHIYLLETPDAVAAMVEAANLEVESVTGYAASGYTLERAMAIRATVSCLVVATRRGSR